MLKTLSLAWLSLAALLVAACQNLSTPPTATPRGTPVGDTGIRASATLQAGASSFLR
jgi:hypothetical protein